MNRVENGGRMNVQYLPDDSRSEWTLEWQKAEDERNKKVLDQQLRRGINMTLHDLYDWSLNDDGDPRRDKTPYHGYRITQVLDPKSSRPIIVLENNMRFQLEGPFDRIFRIIYLSSIIDNNPNWPKWGICDFGNFFNALNPKSGINLAIDRAPSRQ